MIPRYIIRPSGILTTPQLLKASLEAKRTIQYPFKTHRRPSLLRDFFLTYPPEEELEEHAQSIRMGTPWFNHNPNLQQSLDQSVSPGRHFTANVLLQRLHLYRVARRFATADKPSQRALLSHGNPSHEEPRCSLPTPPTATDHTTAAALASRASDLRFPSRKYIVRPLRHTQGIGWRITEDPCDFIEGQEYIQAVYPKNHEYRVICVRGVPIITLLKRVPPDLPRSQPWNHAHGSTFVTVTNPDLDRLRNTSLYGILRQHSILQALDLAGIDIMYRREGEYAVTEVNLCPAITLPDNLLKVARHVHSLPSQSVGSQYYYPPYG